MRSTIYFGPVARAEPIEDWKANQADGAPPGTYVPNMSDADAARWRGDISGWRSEAWCVTARRTIGHCQVVARFDHYSDGDFVTLTTNGRICLDAEGSVELADIMRQGFALLGRLVNGDGAAVKAEIKVSGYPEIP